MQCWNLKVAGMHNITRWNMNILAADPFSPNILNYSRIGCISVDRNLPLGESLRNAVTYCEVCNLRTRIIRPYPLTHLCSSWSTANREEAWGKKQNQMIDNAKKQVHVCGRNVICLVYDWPGQKSACSNDGPRSSGLGFHCDRPIIGGQRSPSTSQ